jgi:hypothetical protein
MFPGTAVFAQDAPAPAAIEPASPGSWEAAAGEAIRYYVGGRSLEETGGAGFNPFGIDGEGLLFALGSFFITATYDGRSIHEGEVAIFPQFTTPRSGAFEPSPTTPAIIPFAMMKAGTCYGGYVSGHPVPDAVFAVDMTGQLCHAATVDELVYAHYSLLAGLESGATQEPAGAASFDITNPTDADLELAVWVAYGAAYSIASADTAFRFFDGSDHGPLREAMVMALEAEGLGAIAVASSPASSSGAALSCAASRAVELHYAFLSDGAGITLVAASPRRMSSYAYDPDVSAELNVRPTRDCRTAGLGRSDTHDD